MPVNALRAIDVSYAAQASFWSLVDIKVRPDACWLWRGQSSNGYGRFKIAARRHAANRVAYALSFGAVAADEFVCHHCDNPACCRPDHLFIGSAADNMHDKVRKQRHAFGERTGTALLTEQEVRQIDAELKSGASQATLARQHGVSKRTVQKIKSRENWQHLWSAA